MNEIELKPCPCCRGTAEIRDCQFFLDVGVKVRCKVCGLQTHGTPIDHPLLMPSGLDESTRYTREQAIEIEAKMWNRRVDHE
jgi:hypothetical protein